MASDLQIPPFTSFGETLFSHRACSDFYRLANKASLHLSHECPGRGRGEETRHCACATYLKFTLKEGAGV